MIGYKFSGWELEQVLVLRGTAMQVDIIVSHVRFFTILTSIKLTIFQKNYQRSFLNHICWSFPSQMQNNLAI